MLLALLATAAVPLQANATDLVSDARKVIIRQLVAPPRTSPVVKLSPEEADAIQARYLGSIGRRLQPANDPSTSTGTPSLIGGGDR